MAQYTYVASKSLLSEVLGSPDKTHLGTREGHTHLSSRQTACADPAVVIEIS